jgi:hypothetical protein
MIGKTIMKAVGKDVAKYTVEKAVPEAGLAMQAIGVKPSKLGQTEQVGKHMRSTSRQAAAQRMNKKAELDHSFISREDLQNMRDRVEESMQKSASATGQWKKRVLQAENRALNAEHRARKLDNQLDGMKGELSSLKDKARDVQSAVKDALSKDISHQKAVAVAREEAKMSVKTPVSKIIRDPLIAGAATVGLGLTLMAGVHGARKLNQKLKADATWKELQRRHPEITRTQKDKDNFEILKQYAPGLAANKDVAYSYLLRVKQTGMVPHEFIQDLVKIQKEQSVGGFAQTASDFGPKNIFRK